MCHIVKSKTGVLQKGAPGTGSVRGKIGSERKMVNEELVRDLSLFALCLGSECLCSPLIGIFFPTKRCPQNPCLVFLNINFKRY